jgi:protein-S-isoprenylcysteine O-methyltransferase Ste14
MSMSYGDVVRWLWVAWLAYWIWHAWGNKKTVFKGGRRGLLVAIVLLWLALDVSGHAGVRWHERVIPETPAWQMIGVILVAAGLGFSVVARRYLGRNWSGQPTLKEGHELITSGPYRYVRHPIYTGLIAAIVGTALVHGELLYFAIVAFAVVGLHFKAKTEEGLMRQQFPEAYPDYARRTKALIPWVL